MVNCPIAFLGYCPDIHCNPCLRKEAENTMIKKSYQLTDDERRVIVTALIGKIQDYTNEIRRYAFILESLPNDSGTMQLLENAKQQREICRELLGRFEK